MIGVFVLQEPTERADHGARSAGAVPGAEVAGEVAQPRRWVGEAFLQVGGGDEGPVGVLLPAGRAQPQPGMASNLATPGAFARRLLGLADA